MAKAENISIENIDVELKVGTLHRYWIRADSIRRLLHNRKIGMINKKKRLVYSWNSYLLLEIYYSLLYVVIEGYKEIKVEDENINLLLEENVYVDSLRLFRNSIFHYQKEQISEKTLRFLETKDSELWINKLNIALKKYFEIKLNIEEMYKVFNTKKINNIFIEAKRLSKKYFKHIKKAK